ncbi:hypothetical protein OHB04_22770 [Streptomyces sp. NBC_01775]|uniref:hypothetical protein n=1 Tax=Streptomyces sp. NBC_01775 TaxID=2975939 RepID=UPI002DDBDAC8|nr:hypothetical protein [Streptomyces sp. NBC_01775]WSB78318.1 hypothetical protein OHB04_22770 [Streptomyces sp. NBC_01775]
MTEPFEMDDGLDITEPFYDDEPDAYRDTLLGVRVPGWDEKPSDIMRREMDRREAAGLPAVPEMHWED